MDDAYDSAADTLRHSLRVGALMSQPVAELVQRSTGHDASKLEPPEKAIFDEYTPKLKTTTYGTDEYRRHLAAMKPALDHHYAENAHHPEHHRRGVAGMTLVDLLEMLADWKASTERVADGSLTRSLRHNAARFRIDDQLMSVLWATARHLGWLDRDECGMPWTAPDGTREACNEQHLHDGLHADGNWDGGQLMWDDEGRLSDGGHEELLRAAKDAGHGVLVDAYRAAVESRSSGEQGLLEALDLLVYRR